MSNWPNAIALYFTILGKNKNMDKQLYKDLEKIFEAGAKAEHSVKEPQTFNGFLVENEELVLRITKLISRQ